MKYDEEIKKIEELKASVYESFGDDALVKLEALDKRLDEVKGLMAMESRQMPTSPEKVMTESQRWTKKFVEAVATRSTFADAMPREMASEVIEKIGQYANLVDKCRIEKMVADVSIAVDAGLPTVTYVAEGSAIGESDAELGTVVLSPKMLACISKVSNILVKDVTFDLVSYVINAVARSFGSKFDYEIMFGTGGTTAIEGITTKAGIKSATSATTLTVTWSEVKKALDALGGYKQYATIVLNQSVATIIKDFKDDNGNYIFTNQNAALTEIQGCPVVISDQMPAPAAGKPLLIAGDFQQYVFGKREDVEVQLLYELYAAKNQTGIKTTCRCDGKVAIPEAFSVIISK